MKNGSLLTITIALLFIFNNSLIAQFEKTWNGDGDGSSWNDDDNWVEDAAPVAGDDVLIISGADVTLNSIVTIKSLQLGNGGTGVAKLTINATKKLTTTGSGTGSDGVHLKTGTSGNESNLVVKGELDISGCAKDGIDIEEYTSLTVESGGKVTISSPGSDGMEVSDDFSNNGTIIITSPSGKGIVVKSAAAGATIENKGSGTIEVSGVSGAGNHALLLPSGTAMTNDGILNLSGTGDNIFNGSGDLTNNGTLKGNGTIDANDFIAAAGSTISPGTSPGTLTFDQTSETDFSNGITIVIEINGTTPGTTYDQIVIPGNGVDISGATLSLSGSYTPMSGDVFTIFSSPNGVTGNFAGIPNNGLVQLNGQNLMVQYTATGITFTWDSALPIELIDFNAEAMEDEVKLSWTTASEINNDYFTIERSTDGREFEEIAMVFGNGNSTELSRYTYMDNNPARGINYYRLKQTDFDGKFTYSELKTVMFETVETVKIYPTLVNDVIVIETGHDLDSDLTVIVRDLTGREYESYLIPSKSNKIELSLNDLVPGSYFVTIYNNNSITTQRIIKL